MNNVHAFITVKWTEQEIRSSVIFLLLINIKMGKTYKTGNDAPYSHVAAK